MGERCRQCGRPTLDPRYDLCLQCNASRNARARPGGTSARPSADRSPDSPCGRGLPPHYLSNGYFDEGRYLRKEIIVDDAQKVAAVLTAADMTSAALRRYFGKVRAMQAKYKLNKDFEAAKVDLYSLEPFVAYTVSRKVAPPVFQAFITCNLAVATKDEQHFEAFVKHFQSVVAFFKERDTQRRGR